MDDEAAYWAVDIPGLREEQARAILAHVAGWDGILGASAVDPKESWLWIYDVATVEMLARILEAAIGGTSLIKSDADFARDLREELTEWLESATTG